jgi:hypothetical protein
VRARPYESWEHDSAHQACQQWITAWRTHHPDDPHPARRFAQHLGEDALQMQQAGVPHIEILRIFAASGHDGDCPCGRPAVPAERTPAHANGDAA